MATITFDKFEYVKKLKAAGIPENQAEAQAEAITSALSDSNTASREDLHREIAGQTKWFIGSLLAFLALFATIIFYGINAKVDGVYAKLEAINAKIESLDAKISAVKNS